MDRKQKQRTGIGHQKRQNADSGRNCTFGRIASDWEPRRDASVFRISDLGILPAVLFAAVMLRQLLKGSQSSMQKQILLLIMLHMLVDFDLQFYCDRAFGTSVSGLR